MSRASDAKSAKNAFLQWCEQNGYVVASYNKRGKDIEVVLLGYPTNENNAERENLAEAALIQAFKIFRMEVKPKVTVSVVNNIQIRRPRKRPRNATGGPRGLKSQGR